ncbi:hypothetical protein Metvu_1044 [Methanocaldococcus vulcanius M7]|uniref:Uncharacterized protein n=1 Tax=Methanocaldococcus vulcanius (strain ATCC 700851 / DSM 12094 / M7) TaxID=579137 RepID=C9RH50_METVM|nr:hypothetical protein [Methanocaldococcus vulcanius]ACX72902.1 hypothetical protein Metvu_1044 [Methanocaldococcus vulcanius M7]
MEKYKYLGKTVKDTGEKGLDNPSEFRGILKNIILDYREGKISKKTAYGRLLLLYRLTYPKYNHKVSKVPEKTLNKIRKEIKEALKEIKGENMTSSKTKKRTVKKFSKKQMISYLKRWLKNRGVDPDLVDLEALVDEKLTYEENKQLVLEHIKPLLKKDENELKNYEDKSLNDLKRHLFDEARKINDEKPLEERENDEQTKADVIFDLNNAKSEEELYNMFLTWMENLDKFDEFDIEGVDYLGDNMAKNEANKEELMKLVRKFIKARIELANYLKQHKVDENELKEIWKEVLKLEGKDVEKSVKVDEKKKAKKRLKPTVNNIIKWMINPAKYDLIGVDE